jgi:general secretion pathway protein B
MSILLDALRKSEEQRRLGTTPTLQTPERTLALSFHEQKWIPAVMIALAAIMIAWIGTAQFNRVEPIPDPSTSAIDSQSAEIPLQTETTQEVLDSLAVNADTPPATTPVKDFTAKPEAPAELKATDDPGVAEQNAQTEPVGREFPGAAPVEAVSAAKGEAAAAPEAEAMEEPIAALVGDLNESDVAARPDTRELAPYAPEPISYWQIPQSLRESMPEMRITVLVYAENPRDRFLLINGKRLQEKDEVIDGLVVEEIQRDRAIFTFRDYRFQLKS